MLFGVEREERPTLHGYAAVSELNWPFKFRSKLMLLKLRNAVQSLFYPNSKINYLLEL